MKPIWVVLIALVALGLGFFLGGSLGGALGGGSGLIVGSSYGACSVIQDAVQQNNISTERGEELFNRFTTRLETLLKDAGFPYQQKNSLAKCEEDIAKFRAEAAKAKAK